MTKSQIHLSEEALDDVLIGMASAEAEVHLAGCAACRERVAAFGADLLLVEQSSMAWSRVRAAGMADVPVSTRPRRLPLATMGWAVAAVLLAALALPAWHHPAWHHLDQHGDQAKTTQVARATVTAENSEAEIAADNQLLHDVDAAINTGEASPFEGALGSVREHPRRGAQPE